MQCQALGFGSCRRSCALPHHITSVVAELDQSHAGLDVPEHAGHVTGGGDDMAVIEETAAAEVAGVGAEFTGTLEVVALFRVQVVDRTDIVETTAGNEIARGRVGAGHDPTRPEWNSVHLV